MDRIRRGDEDTPGGPSGSPTGETTFDDGERSVRIRCPRCGWQPTRDARWQCSCRHVWNTFDTRGVCPKCSVQWQDTQCLKCHAWSKHEAWYESPKARGG